MSGTDRKRVCMTSVSSEVGEAGPFEVAHLIAPGLTNRQLAEALVVTEGSAANYVQRILTKLDFNTRAQIAAWAVEHRLGPSTTR